jgi:4-alpha-glucanotransferase
MSGSESAMDRLSRLAGLQTQYWDIFGTEHVITIEAQRAILGAMGFDAQSHKAALATAREMEDALATRLTAPATVVRRGRGPFAVTVNPPPGAPLEWNITTESGDVLSGHLQADAGGELPLPAALPDGYHRLALSAGSETAEAALIVAPGSCYLPEWTRDGGRQWGLASHLYALRASGDWGIGDLSGLRQLAARAGDAGAELVGINPLHALFHRHPEAASPYSPSSRRFLNPLYIDAARAPGFTADASFAAEAERRNGASHVDYPAVSALKHRALEAAYASFRNQVGDQQAAFQAFRTEGGGALERFCLFEALHEHFDGRPWPEWPAGFQGPGAADAAAFADTHAERIGYHAFLQWLADTQLAEAAEAGAGLYRDLATGVAFDGADCWAEPDATVRGVTFGAPPDDFNADGQAWGMPPPNPRALEASGYAGFAGLVRANMRHARALRIDHVLGLMRLFWIPDGAPAIEGAYVEYPHDDLAGVLALESHRQQCLVVGEDLGTVPDPFRDYMERESMLSYRVFYFERWPDGLFKRPDAYPEKALATATTHDLATLAGYWQGDDLDLRQRIGLADAATTEAQKGARAHDRQRLLAALRDQGLAGGDETFDGGADDLHRLVEAVERYLARSPAALMMVNLDDLLLEPGQLNLPGTIHEYPNWSRRLSADVDALFDDPAVAAILKAVSEERRS